jgi:peptidoglycan/LPS O-acetylase OafA/YrhL
MEQGRKELSLEGLRGLASLIVFFAHFLAAFKPIAIFGYDQSSNLEIFYKTPLGLITAGNFAVCLFFIMSGYVLSIKHFIKKTKHSEIQGDALKRYIRLGLPLFATCFLSFLISRYGFYYNNQVSMLTGNDWFRDYFNKLENKSYLVFFQEMIFKLFSKDINYNYNPPAWTITTELIGSYLTFGILIITRNFRYRFILYIIIFILLSGDFLQNFILGIAIADTRINYTEWGKAIINNNRFMFYLIINCLFILSILLASFPYYVPQKILISSGSFYNVFIFMDNRDFLGGGITLISSFLFFITYRYTNFKILLETKLMQILGQYSFMLYLTHFLSLSSVTSLVYIKTINMSTFANLLLTFGMYIFSTFLTTLVIAKFVDFPSIDISNQLKSFYLKNLEPQKIT